ncbi:MAG: DNA translocase FtsK 4TM domain-containing protein, partial [Acidobacteria bacterium]|nr:DNA translocase FtsK 4TM domain-containing protein [Acidobacteriota bacterium]MDW7984995.1 DNA translocase FtsK 4TM domain-containing protein [Acidobacteriota bacterium]
MKAETSQGRLAGPSETDVRRHRRLQETAALISATVGLFLLLSLISYHPLDVASTASADVAHERANLGGRIGAWIAEYLFQTFGLSAFWTPLLLFLLAYRWARESGPTSEWSWLGFLTTILSTAGLIGLWFPEFRLTVQVEDEALPVVMAGGGWVGQILARYGAEWVGRWGATVAGALGTLI